METLIFWGIIVGIIAVSWLINMMKKVSLYEKFKPQIDSLSSKTKEFEDRKNAFEAKVEIKERELLAQKISNDEAVIKQQAQLQVEIDQKTRELSKKAIEQEALLQRQFQEKKEILDVIALEKSRGFPWLASAYADYFLLNDLRDADNLEHKSHPAMQAAQKVREISKQKREANILRRAFKYQLDYYESLFPWLLEFREIDDEELLIVNERESDSEEMEEDPAKKYLSKGEYEKLSREEKFQRALDRYLKTRKTKWQIGREYERYIGYQFEKEGWDVTYFGIVKGLEDLGRDLLVKKGNTEMIIQCKCWAQHKTIHEKHIFQLFGTTLERWIATGGRGAAKQLLLFEDALSSNPIKPVLYTSTNLSDAAKLYADALGVEYHEKVALERYPCIKCNFTPGHEKIYHLPFDQMYDRTKIQDPKTEKFVSTVAEAEAMGYRRAFRWRGGKGEQGNPQ